MTDVPEKHARTVEIVASEEWSDSALSAAELETCDRLGFKELANSLFGVISRQATPACFGIYGPWGSGKSTLCKKLEEHFRSAPGFRVVWFDTWLYEHTTNNEVSAALLSSIQKELDPDGNRDKWLALKTTLLAAGLSIADCAIRRLSLGGLSVKQVRESVDIAYQDLASVIEKRTKEAEDFQGAFCSLVKSCSADGRKMVVFLDDLDRCLPASAVTLLQRLKNFFMIEGVIFVIAADRAVLERSICETYRYPEEYGRNYLDKIAFRHVNIPNRSFKALVDGLLAEKCVAATLSQVGIPRANFAAKCCQILEPILAREIRSAKACFANLMLFLATDEFTTLSKGGKERCALVALFLMALRRRFPVVFGAYDGEVMKFFMDHLSTDLVRAATSNDSGTGGPREFLKRHGLSGHDAESIRSVLLTVQPTTVASLQQLYTGLSAWL